MSEKATQERPRLYATDANGSTVQLQLTRNRNYPERFLTMFESTCQFLSEIDRPVCYHRTLFHCLAVMDPTQYRRISAREMAEATGQSMTSIDRATKMLTADGVLISKGRAAAKAYRLNNRFVSMTSSEKWNLMEADEIPRDARGRS